MTQVDYGFLALRGSKPPIDPHDYLGLCGKKQRTINFGTLNIGLKQLTLWHKYEQVEPGAQRATSYISEGRSAEPSVLLTSTVFLTSGTSFVRDTLLPNWNDSNNWIDCIGGGSGSSTGSSGSGAGGGGGGGWARRYNLALPSGTIAYTVSAQSAGNGGLTSFHSGYFGAGGSTWGTPASIGFGGNGTGNYSVRNTGGNGGIPGVEGAGGGGGGAAGPSGSGGNGANAGGTNNGASGGNANAGVGGVGGQGGAGGIADNGSGSSINAAPGNSGNYYGSGVGPGGGGGGGSIFYYGGNGGLYGGGGGGGSTDGSNAWTGGVGAQGLIVISWESLTVAPTVSSCAPNSGTTVGNTAVTITGTNFSSISSVTFGGIAATSIVTVNSTTITCRTPAHAAGAVNVVVANSAGSGTGANIYTFVTPSQIPVFITSGTSWPVPANCNKIDIVECVGGGGWGHNGFVPSPGWGGGGGGGGAWSRSTDIAVTPGSTISLQIGDNSGDVAGDTWFNAVSMGDATAKGPGSACSAQHGMNAPNTALFGDGGSAGAGVGVLKYSGGRGGSGGQPVVAYDSGGGGGGGGGAAGPDATGGAGTTGASSAGPSVGGTGGYGGYGNAGVNGGGIGTAGGVGGGGGNGGSSGVGSNGTTYNSAYGSGGGSGGGGGGGNIGAGGSSGTGGNYGAGSGGGGGAGVSGPVVGVASTPAPGFIYLVYSPIPAPIISSILPSTGIVFGGIDVTLNGTNFINVSSVKFDGLDATSIVIVNSTTITCKTPAHAAGAVSVIIAAAGGSGSTIFTYYLPPAKPSFNLPMLGI